MSKQKAEKDEARKKEEDVYTRFLAEGGRGPRRGTRETLIAQHLAYATFATNKRKVIYHVTSASMHIEPEEVEGIDLELLKGIFLVNDALAHPHIQQIPMTYYPRTGWTYRYIYKIVWGFPPTPENFQKYVSPWYETLEYFSEYIDVPKEKRVFVACPYCNHRILDMKEREFKKTMKTVSGLLKEKCGKQRTVTREVGNPRHADYPWEPVIVKKQFTYWTFRCPGCDERIDEKSFSLEEYQVPKTNPDWIFFFTATRYLNRMGYDQLWRNFVAWAHPICMHAKGVLSEFVSPSLVKEVAESLYGEREEAQKNADQLA